jgi:hypothetical protein
VGVWGCEFDVAMGVLAKVDDHSVWEYQYEPNEVPSEYYKRINISDVMAVSYTLKELEFTPFGAFEIVVDPDSGGE